MTTCLGKKSCSFGLLCVSCLNAEDLYVIVFFDHANLEKKAATSYINKFPSHVNKRNIYYMGFQCRAPILKLTQASKPEIRDLWV